MKFNTLERWLNLAPYHTVAVAVSSAPVQAVAGEAKHGPVCPKLNE